MKKVIIAIDSFKGSLSSVEAGRAAAKGLENIFPECETVVLPVADGGEGLLDALVTVTNGQYIDVEANSPLMEKLNTRYAVTGDNKTAIIEMAAVNGLTKIPAEKRNPLETSTYGTGELIKHALDNGYREFIVGIGGSATNDAGMGMLQALGYRFLNKEGKELGFGGKYMEMVDRIDAESVHPALSDSTFTIACDVDNPFYGPQGAAFVFAPQKGADEQTVKKLDDGMRSFSEVIRKSTGKDISDVPGSGAAGGLGGAFIAFTNATLKSGIDLILEKSGFISLVHNVNLIITGEGKIDSQTAHGKVAYGVCKAAKKHSVPVIAITGALEDHTDIGKLGFNGVFCIQPGPVTVEKAMEPAFAAENISRLVSNICHLVNAFDVDMTPGRMKNRRIFPRK